MCQWVISTAGSIQMQIFCFSPACFVTIKLERRATFLLVAQQAELIGNQPRINDNVLIIQAAKILCSFFRAQVKLVLASFQQEVLLVAFEFCRSMLGRFVSDCGMLWIKGLNSSFGRQFAKFFVCNTLD